MFLSVTKLFFLIISENPILFMFGVQKVSGTIENIRVETVKGGGDPPNYFYNYYFTLLGGFPMMIMMGRNTNSGMLDINNGDRVTLVAKKEFLQDSYTAYEFYDESTGSYHNSATGISGIWWALGIIFFYYMSLWMTFDGLRSIFKDIPLGWLVVIFGVVCFLAGSFMIYLFMFNREAHKMFLNS